MWMNSQHQGRNQLPDVIEIPLSPIAFVFNEFDELGLYRMGTSTDLKVF